METSGICSANSATVMGSERKMSQINDRRVSASIGFNSIKCTFHIMSGYLFFPICTGASSGGVVVFIYPRVVYVLMKTFWPSAAMREAAREMAARKNLDWGDRAVWKMLRRVFQERVDKALFSGSPTSRELLLNHNIDINTWDDGDGMIEFDAGYIERETTVAYPMGDEGEKPPPTGRRWQGERWDASSGGFLNPIPGARKDYFAWYQMFILNEDNFGHGYIPLGDIHEEWALLLDHPDQMRDLFLCSRDHYKTSFIHTGYYTYLICERQDLVGPRGIFSLAWDKDLTMETFDAVKRNLTENNRILTFYGYLPDDERSSTQTKMFFQFQPKANRYPGLFCAPIKGGRITGTHAYLYALDDIMVTELTPALMKRLREIFTMKLYPAMGPGARLVVTGTIKGYTPDNDVYLWLEQNPALNVYRYPAANAMPTLQDIDYEIDEVPIINPLTGKVKLQKNGKPFTRKHFRVTSIKNVDRYVMAYPQRYDMYRLAAKMLEYKYSEDGLDKFFSEYFLVASDPKGRFFDINRVRPVNESRFFSVEGVLEYCRAYHCPVFLWIDPGGQGAHGIAIVVMTFINGEYFLLECQTIRAPVVMAAKVIANLIAKYRVTIWGCEGNFNQRDTHGYTIDSIVKAEFALNSPHLYTPCVIANNTGKKMQRIATHVGAMLGFDGGPYQFYIAPEMLGISDFRMQVRRFGTQMEGDGNHEYDILDSIASVRIHLLDMSIAPVLIAV